jgi:hypothetical protein
MSIPSHRRTVRIVAPTPFALMPDATYYKDQGHP